MACHRSWSGQVSALMRSWPTTSSNRRCRSFDLVLIENPGIVGDLDPVVNPQNNADYGCQSAHQRNKNTQITNRQEQPDNLPRIRFIGRNSTSCELVPQRLRNVHYHEELPSEPESRNKQEPDYPRRRCP